MSLWYIVLLSLVVGSVANEHPPSNPPYLLEEIKATAESRILVRVEELLQTLSAKIKVLDDGIDETKRDISSLFHLQNETQELLKTTNQSFTRRMIDQELKLERLPEVIRDINSKFLVQNETQEMLKTTSKSLTTVSEQLQSFSTSATQRITELEHNLEPLSHIIRHTNEMIKGTNKSFTQRIMNLEHKLERTAGNTGVHLMQPNASNKIIFEVFRDWTTNHVFGGDWIVFQRRFNGFVNFNRNWTEYKNGFGDVRGEHWLGLNKLHSIVQPRRHELLIVLEDFDGVMKYAHYDNLQIGDESEKYILKSIGSYTGTAGDSFTYHKNNKFSTYDQDNDKYDGNCSESYKGGWWFSACQHSHLNGEYLNGDTKQHFAGISWSSFRGHQYSLKSSKMMVRPVA